MEDYEGISNEVPGPQLVRRGALVPPKMDEEEDTEVAKDTLRKNEAR